MNKETASAVREVIHHRRSVRFFDERLLPEAAINQMLEAAIDAPSGSNWQNQRFLVIRDRAEIDRIGRCRFVWPWIAKNYGNIRDKNPAGLLGRASVLILVFADAEENDRRRNGEYHIWESLEAQNCAAAIQNMLLMATALGIGTCWVSASEKMSYSRLLSGRAWREVLSGYAIKPSYKIQGIVVAGYPKITDDLGYPKGEAKHGATIWQDVPRREISYYLIDGERAAPRPAAGAGKGLLVKISGLLIKALLRMVRALDRLIWDLEMSHHKGEVRLTLNKDKAGDKT